MVANRDTDDIAVLEKRVIFRNVGGTVTVRQALADSVAPFNEGGLGAVTFDTNIAGAVLQLRYTGLAANQRVNVVGDVQEIYLT